MIPFLAGLGISEADLARSPTVEAFPTGFNQGDANKLAWESAIAEASGEVSDARTAWALAIKLYIEICEAEGLYPFTNLRMSTTDQIVSMLDSARRYVVRFLNLSNILSITKVRATRREVLMNSHGFVLCVYGRAEVKDPTFTEWLLKMPYPGFRIKHEGRYVKTLAPGITMVVYNDYANGPQRWNIGYEIAVPLYPKIPGNPTASAAELETYVLKILWPPIMKSRRTYKYQPKPL